MLTLGTIALDIFYIMCILLCLIVIYAIVMTIIHDIHKRIVINKFTNSISNEDVKKIFEELIKIASDDEDSEDNETDSDKEN